MLRVEAQQRDVQPLLRPRTHGRGLQGDAVALDVPEGDERVHGTRRCRTDVALLHAARALEKLKPANDDQKVGIDIVRKALPYPTRLIVENAGTDGAIVVGKLLESKSTNYGYDAQKGEYTDLVKAGIIDPTKVVRCALQDASSVAGLLITTEAMVADRPEKKAPPMPGGHGHGGMGDMDF